MRVYYINIFFKVDFIFSFSPHHTSPFFKLRTNKDNRKRKAKFQADLISAEKHDSTFLPLNGNDPWMKEFFVKQMEIEDSY